jgi:hypothetical protein
MFGQTEQEHDSLDSDAVHANWHNHRLQPTPLRGLVSRHDLVMCGVFDKLGSPGKPRRA